MLSSRLSRSISRSCDPSCCWEGKVWIEISIFLFVLLKMKGKMTLWGTACVGVNESERLEITAKSDPELEVQASWESSHEDSMEKTAVSRPHCRFRVTHIGKRPPVQEQQDGALPAGSRQPSTEELERSSERLQWERALNGTVPTGGLQNGAIQTGTQSTGRSAEQSLSASPAVNTPASSGTRDSRRVDVGSGPLGSGPLGSGPLGSGPLESGPLESGPLESGPLGSGPLGSGPLESGRTGSSLVGPGTAGSLKDAGSAPGSSSRQRRLMSMPALGVSSPNIPGELAREGAGICLEEIGLASADEVSDIHGSLSLQEQADELGRDDSSRRQSGGEDGKQQEPSAEEQDRV
ncbi:RELT-like protein 2 isoform X3 [Parus major]|uniref:RELT-like protein 2 isoform X3 n=1 Tax=Parus major TaxID=9157 RepID=UPI001443D170|nr:RELT-like protein 2 isoform X3 [Parus major]